MIAVMINRLEQNVEALYRTFVLSFIFAKWNESVLLVKISQTVFIETNDPIQIR